MNIKIKWTPQRLAIIKYLAGNKEHPSVEDIYTTLSKDYPTMSMATVYNVVEFLKRIGRIKEIFIDPEKKRFDSDLSTHHHALCIKCKRVFDIFEEIKISELNIYLPDFQILDKQLTIFVLCPNCRDKKDLKLGLREYQCTNCGSLRIAKHKPQKCHTCGKRDSLTYLTKSTIKNGEITYDKQ